MTFTVSETVSDETLNCIVTIESAGRLDAKAGTSTALGLGQFLNKTWLGVVEKHRPDLMQGRSQAQVLALRTDPGIAIEMLARFTEDNQKIVGMNCTGGDLYLAHFLGAGAAQKLFRSSPSAAVEPLVGAAAVHANLSILQGKTCAQVRAWAAKRMLQSSGHAWVAKYYQPPAAAEVAEAAEIEQAPEDIPDTQSIPTTIEDTPVAKVTMDDSRIITGKVEAIEVTDEHWYDWAVKLAKSRMQYGITGLSGISLASLGGVFNNIDHLTLAIICATVVALFIALIVLRGRKP